MSQARPEQSQAGAGFTLIEVMVSLLLFALISLAGINLIETVLGVQHRTEGRAERVSQIDRALFLVTADCEQLTGGPRLESDTVSLTRAGADHEHTVVYRFFGGSLHRSVDGTDREILGGLANANWRFYKSGKGWAALPSTQDDPSRPRAVELTATLAPQPNAVSGPLRRVIVLPEVP